MDTISKSGAMQLNSRSMVGAACGRRGVLPTPGSSRCREPVTIIIAEEEASTVAAVLGSSNTAVSIIQGDLILMMIIYYLLSKLLRS